MPVLVRVLPIDREDGLWITVATDTAYSDEVGPLRPGEYVNVPLQEHDIPKPKGVSQRLRKRALAQEKLVADDIGGRTQPGSGNQEHAKGDVRLRGQLRYEHKSTTTGAYRLTLDLLTKIRSECGLGESPAFGITFLNARGIDDRWVCIPYEVWVAHYQHK